MNKRLPVLFKRDTVDAAIWLFYLSPRLTLRMAEQRSDYMAFTVEVERFPDLAARGFRKMVREMLTAEDAELQKK